MNLTMSNTCNYREEEYTPVEGASTNGGSVTITFYYVDLTGVLSY